MAEEYFCHVSHATIAINPIRLDYWHNRCQADNNSHIILRLAVCDSVRLFSDSLNFVIRPYIEIDSAFLLLYSLNTVEDTFIVGDGIIIIHWNKNIFSFNQYTASILKLFTSKLLWLVIWGINT